MIIKLIANNKEERKSIYIFKNINIEYHLIFLSYNLLEPVYIIIASVYSQYISRIGRIYIHYNIYVSILYRQPKNIYLILRIYLTNIEFLNI